MGRYIRRPQLQLKLPTVDEIIYIHDRQVAAALDRSEPGIYPTGRGSLDYLLNRINEYEEIGPFIQMVKVAGLMYEYINRRHVFIDGNKRTAIVCVFETCIMNGFIFKAKDRKYETEFSKKVASTTLDEIGMEEIYKYFDDRIMPIKEYFEPQLVHITPICPQCNEIGSIFNRKCNGCGKMALTSVRLTHKGILREYDFYYRRIELDRIARRNRGRTVR